MTKIQQDCINYLTTVLYGTWVPPKATSLRTYVQGVLIGAEIIPESNHFQYGHLDSMALMVLANNPKGWLSRFEIADDLDIDPESLKKPLANLVKQGAISVRTVPSSRGRPTHVYQTV